MIQIICDTMVGKIDNTPKQNSRHSNMNQLPPPEFNGFHADRMNSSASLSTFAPDEVDPSITDPQTSVDEIFDVLSNCRRRYVAYFLKNTTQPVELGTLATQIAAWETDQPMAEVTRAERKRAFSAPGAADDQQVHLPKMKDTGLIRFEKPSSVIEPTSLLATIELESAPTEDDSRPWHHYYLSVSLASMVVAGASVAGIWPARLVSIRVWFLATIGLLLVLASVHTYLADDVDFAELMGQSTVSDHE